MAAAPSTPQQQTPWNYEVYVQPPPRRRRTHTSHNVSIANPAEAPATSAPSTTASAVPTRTSSLGPALPSSPPRRNSNPNSNSNTSTASADLVPDAPDNGTPSIATVSTPASRRLEDEVGSNDAPAAMPSVATASAVIPPSPPTSRKVTLTAVQQRSVERAMSARLYLFHQSGPNAFMVGADNPNHKFTVKLGTQNCSCRKQSCIHLLFVMIRVLKLAPNDSRVFVPRLKNFEVDAYVPPVSPLPLPHTPTPSQNATPAKQSHKKTTRIKNKARQRTVAATACSTLWCKRLGLPAQNLSWCFHTAWSSGSTRCAGRCRAHSRRYSPRGIVRFACWK
eukprot:m.215118 g.215118  ORF g.215118 m.215118 type:complete len:336 (+) comp18630_c2_seq4:198-1205(+)